MNILCRLKSQNGNGDLRRIKLSQDIENQLSSYLAESLSYFNKAERINFNGEYKPDENQVLVIKNYKGFKANEFDNILIIPVLEEAEIETIKYLIFSNNDLILFQTFDSRKIIKPEKLYLLYSSNTYSRIDNKGLVVDAKIDAVFLKNESVLLFSSYHNASKIFDLSNYYREATENEIKENFTNKEIFIGELDLSIINSRYRKKIYQIIKNDVLKKVKDNFKSVNNYANEFGLFGVFDENNSKIILPQNKKDIEKLINFLNDDLYKSPISDIIYETNSKRISSI